MSDTKVYEPEIRALPGTASEFCEVVVLKSRTLHQVIATIKEEKVPGSQVAAMTLQELTEDLDMTTLQVRHLRYNPQDEPVLVQEWYSSNTRL